MPDSLPVRWTPDRRPTPAAGLPLPTLPRALWRGACSRCPACGQGRLFASWLRVASVCEMCAAPLGLINADDAPPYFTVFIVAHVVIGALVALDRVVVLSVGTEMLIFLPATLALVLVLIRPVKGATVGLMMKLGLMRAPDPAGLEAAIAITRRPDLPRPHAPGQALHGTDPSRAHLRRDV